MTDARERPESDYIDEVRGQWDAIFPGLDTSMVALMGRISRIAQVVQARSDAVLAAQGITRGEFDVISLLARHGGTLSPTRVSTELIISGAGVTKRLKRLASAGLITRIPDPADGRGSLVQLTAEAWDLLRPVLESVLGFEGRLLADIAPDVQEQLAGNLRELLLSIEADATDARDTSGSADS
ncbi:MarR family winged helix-turn-helix transcriptional regulator [Brevibacterium sp. UCMA 11752]|uniref:MarR family winged helix-turn-helix transcriptional regulator n=1 Tax=Brevibacterium sp. UCMA 11752 TaxID=2745946 RepID=UPI001F1DB192|nr:MarR family transcriptional regulator [Brevibacterium sp. UCMA 11752]MCF2586219.1 MarR family transcriptional regulator [Brevibacterium sp. UCMA 11752]